MTWYLVTGPDGAEQQVFQEGDGPLLGYDTDDGFSWQELGDVLDDVAAARVEKWQEVKTRRDLLETGFAPTPFGLVQIDEKSKTKISGVALAATIALAAGAPFEETFTLADNSSVVLDAPGAQAMGLAVAAYVSALFDVARDLRVQIDAPDQTAEQVRAIDIDAASWPSTGSEPDGEDS
jgi:Domain of unknown function (DUF4376)